MQARYATQSATQIEPAKPLFFYCFTAFLLLAPLYKAGNRALPLMLLELAAVAIIFAMIAVHRVPVTLPRMLALAIALLLVYPLVQLVPLPAFVWRILPGHGEYASVLERFAADGDVGFRALSIIPRLTEYGWLALLPPLACFLAARWLSTGHAALLLLVMSVFVGAEALLGLLQIAPATRGFFYFGLDEPGQRVAIGTFINKNHLAAMLAMILPVIVGLLVYSMRPGLRRRHRPMSMVMSEAVAQRALLFAAAVMILVCLVYTRSRAGLASALVGLACSGIVLVRARAASVGTKRTRAASYLVITLVAISIIIALTIGIAPVMSGFDPQQVEAGAGNRMRIYGPALRAGIEFLPFGSGLSTFADVFPRFQASGGFFDYAHNDYVQAFVELGMVGALAIALLLIAYAKRMLELLGAEGGRSFTLLQLGAGLGMLPMILHSLFDFALHMPANAMWFATLAGVLFHKGVNPREPLAGELRKPKREWRAPQSAAAPAAEADGVIHS